MSNSTAILLAALGGAVAVVVLNRNNRPADGLTYHYMQQQAPGIAYMRQETSGIAYSHDDTPYAYSTQQAPGLL